MSEAPLPDGVGRKPTPMGLIGLTVAEQPLNDDLRPLRTFAPRRTWRRFLKLSLFAVVPFYRIILTLRPRLAEFIVELLEREWL